MWTTSQNAIDDLRRLISDGPQDKLCDQKLVLGFINGTNTRFKTFERRRLTDFTVAPTGTDPTGVYKNFVRLSNTAIAGDDLVSGSFTTTVAPVDGDELRATYYYQWFLDTEVDEFLKNASQWTGNGVTYASIQDGLQPAVLHYAAQEAYTKLSLWFSTKISNQYQLDDAPDPKNKGVNDSYSKLAEFFHKKATDLRNEFYSNRQGQALAPNFKSIAGRVRDYTPRR